MRIRIRRCLSMLRNTSDGNELALPLPMPSKGDSGGACILHKLGSEYLVTRSCYSDDE